MTTLRIALLHLAPITGDIAYNQRLLQRSVSVAVAAGADWIITPELVTSGYRFSEVIGTSWIDGQPDALTKQACCRLDSREVTVFLGCADRDPSTGSLHNSILVLSPIGRVLARHRKVNIHVGASENWATPGGGTTIVDLQPVGRIGLLICSDLCLPDIAHELRSPDVRLVVVCAAWAIDGHDPLPTWARASEDLDVPLVICNRTGADHGWSFYSAESAVFYCGQRLISASCLDSTVFLVDWNLKKPLPHSISLQRSILMQPLRPDGG